MIHTTPCLASLSRHSSHRMMHFPEPFRSRSEMASSSAGGATRYHTNLKINELLDKGFIREVTP